MKLIVVRHGESDLNTTNLVQGISTVSNLTPLGIKQAQSAAEALKDTRIDFAYISPLQRAVQTANEILKFHPETEIIYDDLLKERNFGEFEGHPSDLLHKAVAESGKSYIEFKPEKGESWLEAGERFKGYYHEHILSKHLNSDSTVLVVAHGSVLMHFLLWLDNKMNGQTDFLEYYQTHRPKNTAITSVEVDSSGKHQVLKLNDVSHLGITDSDE